MTMTKSNKQETYTTEQFSVDLKSTSAEYVAAESDFNKGVMYRVAVLTAKAIRNNYLAPKGGVVTPADYAAAFDKSAAWVTKAKRLGRATEVGFTPDHSEWVDLCRYANDKTVADVLMHTDDNGKGTATMAKVRKAINTRKAELQSTQKNGASSRAAKPNDGTKANGKGEGSDEGTLTLTGSVSERVAILVTSLSEGVKSLTADEWIAVEGRLSEIITRENTTRAKLAATPKVRAPKPAPPVRRDVIQDGPASQQKKSA